MKHLLIIGSVWPEPGSSAAGRRMMDLIRMFQAFQWEILFTTPAAASAYRVDLPSMGIAIREIRVNCSGFDELLAEFQPDAVMFDRFMMEEQFGWRVQKYCPQALRILDTEDLHFLRKARQQAFRQQRELAREDLLTDLSRREIASIYRCDLSLIISRDEMQLLQQQFSIDEKILWYLPFLTDVGEIQQTGCPGFSQRCNFSFAGMFRHEPNLDAVRYLKTRLWPLLRKRLPEAELRVAGAYITEEIRQYHSPRNGFLVEGRVDSIQSFFAGIRVNLVPLRFGAGLKGKIVDAMMAGAPNVTTRIGAEGIDNVWPQGIAGNDQEFVDIAVALYQDPLLWQKAQKAGWSFLQDETDSLLLSRDFFEHMEGLMNNLEDHRQQNFIGSLLHYHTQRSTEYMARWIECKNRQQDDSPSGQR